MFMKIREAQIFSDIVVDIIKKEQQIKGISSYTLAHRCGLSEASLSYIFHHKNRPTLYSLKMITDALDVCLSEILKQAEIQYSRLKYDN